MIHWRWRTVEREQEGGSMSHTIELTEEQYQTLREAAEQRGQTADSLIAELIEALHTGEGAPKRYETDDWFRHLGATGEQIAEAERIARDRSSADS
jgi:histone acetyltransferase (RNA polymerase elongator complex component)